VALAVVGAVAFETSASAEAIDIVAISDAGPDRSIPIDKPFYIAGSGKGSKRVVVLIVRSGNARLLGSDPDKCATVRSRLGKFRDAKGAASDVLPPTTPTEAAASSVWTDAPDDYRVKVSSEWSPSGDSKDFRIFIDHDGDFFSAGHSYCVLVYRDEVKTNPDAGIADALLEAINSSMKEIASCAGQADARTCKFDSAALDAAIAAIADDKVRAQIITAKNAVFPRAFDMATSAKRIELILTSWLEDASVAAATGASRRVAIPDFIGLDDPGLGPLARATIALLSLKGELRSVYAKHVLDGYYTTSTKTELRVAQLGFLSDHKVRLATDDSHRTIAVLGTSATLLDLLELSQGRLPLGAEYLAPSAYEERLHDSLGRYRSALTGDDVKLLDKARDSLARLDAAINASIETYRGLKKPPEVYASSQAALFYLGQWLEERVLADCHKEQREAWKMPAPNECGDASVHGWSSYEAAELHPLDYVLRALEKYRAAQPVWLEQRPILENATIRTVLATDAIEARLEYTEQTWVFSYVSPVLGYAAIAPRRDGVREGTELYYVAAQIHLVPNPENRPSKGWGLIALELGFSPGLGNFGPDNRYRGLGGIAPVFVGLSIHLIPYTGLSAGFMFAERRSTTVPQERTDRFAAGYVGLNVDFNLPELVRKASTRSSTTVPQ
jgi:hypothetical protein